MNVRSSQMCASETPLHVAATYGNISVVKALVEGGAKVDISDDRAEHHSTMLKRASHLVAGVVMFLHVLHISRRHTS